jgi:hypothetical protein
MGLQTKQDTGTQLGFAEITPDQVGVAPIPVSEGSQSYSTLGGWNFLIYAASDMQDDAWESVRWMTDPE